MKRAALAVSLLFLTCSVSHAADVIRGCYHKKSGQLRVLIPPDSCRSNELPIKFATGDIVEQLAPNVYDADGQFLGTGTVDDLYIPSLRMWVAIDLMSEIGEPYAGDLWFESADCSGPAMAQFQFFNRVFRTGGGWAEAKYYTGGPQILTWDGQNPLAGSYIEGQTGLCNVLAGPFSYAGPYTTAVEVTLPFTTPVAMPLRLAAPTVGNVPKARR